MKKLFLIFAICLLFPILAFGGTSYYFDPGATSGTGVGTYANPFYTLAQANAKVFSTGDDLYFKVGTTLNVPAGEYLNIVWNGTSGDWVHIGAYYGENQFGLNGGARPILECNNAAGPTETGVINKYPGTYPSRADAYTEVSDLRISQPLGFGILAQDVNYWNVKNCYIYNSATHGGGITATRSTYVIIDGNTVDAGQWPNPVSAGLIAVGQTGSNHAIISNNIVFGLAIEGIDTYHFGSDCEIYGNIVYDTANIGIYIERADHANVHDNIVYSSTAKSGRQIGSGIAIDNEKQAGFCNDIGYNNIHDNYVANCVNGIMMTVEDPDCINQHNLIYNNRLADNTYSFRFWTSYSIWHDNQIYYNIAYTSNNSTMIHSDDCSPLGVTWGHNIFDDAVSGNAATYAHTVASPFDKTTGWNALVAGTVDSSYWDLSSAGASAVSSYFGTAPIVETPTFSPDGSDFETSQIVTITCTTTGASIYYTDDGTTPTSGSTLYSTPFTLTATKTIKAIGIKASYGDSAVASAIFTKTSSVNAPYGGIAWPVPGTIRAENYDTGGEGVAYHALTAGNAGNIYRFDDVDVWATVTAGAEPYATIFATGEWTEYTFSVASTDDYVFTFLMGSPVSSMTLSASIDGAASFTGSMAVPNLGDPSGYEFGNNVTPASVNIAAGDHVLRLTGVNGGSLNVYKITVEATTPTIPAAPANFKIRKGP